MNYKISIQENTDKKYSELVKNANEMLFILL